MAVNADRLKYVKTLKMLEKLKVTTICLEANCPNRYSCFANKTATFLVLGNKCTRNCLYCNVENGRPLGINDDEINHIISAIEKLALDYVVITQVTRDDLVDGGADYIAKLIRDIKKRFANIKVEVLISDLQGCETALLKILQAKPDVLNHNIEIVKNKFLKLRPDGNYNRSLSILAKSKKLSPNIITKSGFMIGVGESNDEIYETLLDLKKNKVDIVTIGQYLAPNNIFPVVKYYNNEDFLNIKKLADSLHFKHLEAGYLVRSSYNAKRSYYECVADN